MVVSIGRGRHDKSPGKSIPVNEARNRGIGSHAIEARTDKRILNRVLKREKRERAELVKRLT